MLGERSVFYFHIEVIFILDTSSQWIVTYFLQPFTDYCCLGNKKHGHALQFISMFPDKMIILKLLTHRFSQYYFQAQHSSSDNSYTQHDLIILAQ